MTRAPPPPPPPSPMAMPIITRDQFSETYSLFLPQYQTLILFAKALLLQKDAQLKRLWLQNLALKQRLRSITLQNQQLLSIACRSEMMASALRVSLETVVRQNEKREREREMEEFGDSEESSCWGTEMEDSRFMCSVCGERRASILLMPCNHLCMCGECEEVMGECPCCRQIKGNKIQVML